MGASDVDRLRECRAFGTLAGITTAGIAFWGYFVGEIYRVALLMQQTQLRPFEFYLVNGFLVLGIFAFALGAGGVAGRHVIYPVRTGSNATATSTMTYLMIGGVVVAGLVVAAAFLRQVSIV